MACRGDVVERARRGVVSTALLWSDRRVELGDLADCHDGARKSRNSGCCAWVFEVLKLRYVAASAHDRCAFFKVESALRHLLEAVIVVDIVCVVFWLLCVAGSSSFRLQHSIGNALEAKSEAGKARRGRNLEASPCPI